jgi:sirohydrochlorin ferrochelatase
MTGSRPETSVLVVAHGERGGAATNDNAVRLAQTLAAQRVADEVGCGFIKGVPAVRDALAAFRAPEVVVYPLLLSDGHFASVALPRLLHEAMPGRPHRSVRILPAMGLDPGLPGLIVDKASDLAAARGLNLRQTMLILLAHGSRRDPASQRTTARVARAARKLARFGYVRAAFLDQSPTLTDVAATTRGPAVVVGLFAGEGRHGADDVWELIAGLRRDEIVFAGNVVSFPGIADLIAAGIARASAGRNTLPMARPPVPREPHRTDGCAFLPRLRSRSPARTRARRG